MSPGAIDKALVRRHLLAIDKAVHNLSRHVGKPIEDMEDDLDTLWAIERGLQLCAQNAIDIATHIAVSAGCDAPDYASAIAELGKIGILPVEFAKRFRGVAGFRNVLVHGYLGIETSRIHSVLNERLGDFTEFASYIEVHLAKD